MDIINSYIHGGESVSFDGFGNASRSFNGTDDYIATANDVDVVFGSTFTIAFWLKLDDGQPASTQQFFGVDNGTDIARILVTNGGVVRAVYRSDNGIVSVADLTASLTNGQQAWVHYAWVVTPTEQKIYVDGLEATLDGTNDGDMAGVTMGNFATALDFYIGARNFNGSTNQFTAGNYADFRIYDADIGDSGVTSLYAGTNVTTNLVGHWLKDTPSLLDHAGNNDATNYGSKFSYDKPSPGLVFGSMSRSFNGNDYIDLGDNNDLSFGNASTDSPFSISAWVRMDNATHFWIATKHDNSSQSEWLFAISGDDKLYFAVYDESVSIRRGRTSSSTFTSYENQWIHLTATYDGTGGTNADDGMTVYLTTLGGTTSTISTVDFNSGSYTAMHNGTRGMQIGGWTGNNRYANGNIADVRLYNKELSSDEVQNIADGTNVTTNLIGHWLTNNDDVKDYAGVNDGTNYGSIYSYDNPNALVEYGGASRYFDAGARYVDLGNDTSLDLTSKLSISVWVKPGLNHNGAILSKWTSGAVDDNSYTIYMGQDQGNDKITFLLQPSLAVGGGFRVRCDGNISLSTTEWNHIACIADGSTMRLYVNGVLDNSVSFTDTIKVTTKKLLIGKLREEDNVYTYNGRIADVRLYDNDLSSTEVYELYKGVDHRTNLIGQWLTNRNDVEDKAGINDGTNFGSTYSTDSPL